MGKDVNNRAFASDPNFKKACEKANVSPTKRQASKFRMKKGVAYKAWLYQGGNS